MRQVRRESFRQHVWGPITEDAEIKIMKAVNAFISEHQIQNIISISEYILSLSNGDSELNVVVFYWKEG